MKKIMVTGAAGLLGQHLVNRLLTAQKNRTSHYSILAVDVAENPFEKAPDLDFLRADLTAFESVSMVFSHFGPDQIFNCASFNDVDSTERMRDTAKGINVGLVGNLLTLKSGRIIQFSSDYVFNGAAGPYGEDDTPDPICYYGRTKLEAERLLQDSGRDHLVIRSNVLYGIGKNVRMNFVTWLVENLRANKKVRIATDQFGNPTSAGNLAEASIEAAEKTISGILHVAGKDYLSRYDMALGIASFFKLDAELIVPVSTEDLNQEAPRPLRGGLKIDKALKLLKTRPLGLEEGLKRMGGL